MVAIIHDDQDISQCSDVIIRNQSMDSLQSSFTNGSSSPSRNSEYFIHDYYNLNNFLRKIVQNKLPISEQRFIFNYLQV